MVFGRFDIFDLWSEKNPSTGFVCPKKALLDVCSLVCVESWDFARKIYTLKKKKKKKKKILSI